MNLRHSTAEAIEIKIFRFRALRLAIELSAKSISQSLVEVSVWKKVAPHPLVTFDLPYNTCK